MTRFRVTDIFTIPGRGSVIAGTLEDGELTVGDRLQLESPKGSIPFVAKGLERDRELVKRARAGESIAISTGPLNLESLSDGFENGENDGERRVVALTIKDSTKRWWEFWR